ncbi:Arrestin domain-containing protein 2 [Mortierella sp. GBA35]|nr:Arrestin domain-containing protein 2 [Mortierella sp. GBA35]
MKKLSIDLDEEAIKATPFRPGDTFTGKVNFNTSASLKYTCIKVRFVGLVSTKVAKAIEEVYVLNQQTVLLGNPNNATTSVLDEGKHSWPFHFAVPLQHLPSSGKYRHGIVKYTLTAVVTSTKFLGGVQDTKVNKTIELVDHVHDANYSNPVSIMGSCSIKLATATVSIARSAYRPGQLLTLSVDLAHSQKIRRDPGCWIQLIRKESYSAKDQMKEYSHVIAASAHAIKIESGSHNGKILAEITLPVDATPTMDTTKIISIQYHIMFLFDMRSQTGFFERRSKKSVNQKLRKKILESPGGFEVDLPIIMDIVSEGRPPLEIPLDFQATLSDGASGCDSFYRDPYDTIVVATNQLAIAPAGPALDQSSSPVLTPSGSPSTHPVSSPSSSSYPVSSSSTSFSAPTRMQDPFSAPTKAPYIPQTQYVRTVPPRYSTLRPSFKARGSDSSQGSNPPPGEQSPRSHTLPLQSSHSSHSRTTTNPITDNDLFFKPLPTIPPNGAISPSTSPEQRQQQQQRQLYSPSSTSTYTSYGSTAEPIPANASPRTLGPVASSSSSSSPPPLVHQNRIGNGSSINSSYGYPPEKSAPFPVDSLFSSHPMMGSVQNATAPSAVDLGLGPMSPLTSFAYVPPPPSVVSPPFPNVGSSSSNSTSGHDYRNYHTQQPQQEDNLYQQLPPQPSSFRYNALASASAPRLYSPDDDYSQSNEPVPSIPSMPPHPPADVYQSDQFRRYTLLDHPSTHPVSPYTH